MPLKLPDGRAVVLIRQSAFERNGLSREAIDARYNLTDEEFRVEEGLIALGPLPSDDMLPELVDDLEKSGSRLLRRLLRAERKLAGLAHSLRVWRKRPRDLEALLDDSPLLDEGHSVLDSVDHHVRSGSNDCSAE